MAQYKSIIVNVTGKVPDNFFEMEPPRLMAALNDGWQIKDVHQIATSPSFGGQGGGVVGVVILTYVLFKP